MNRDDGPMPLIPVRSESELKAGMTVVLKPCGRCRKRESIILIRQSRGGLCDHLPSGKVVSGCNWWTVAGWCPGFRWKFCPALSVREGRLFRLDTGIDEEADARRAEADSIAASVRARVSKLPLMTWTKAR